MPVWDDALGIESFNVTTCSHDHPIRQKTLTHQLEPDSESQSLAIETTVDI